MKLARAVVKFRVPILIITVLLMIPSFIGMAATRINYDMLTYLPSDMDTVKGQDILLDEFGKGAFSFIIVEDMPEKDVAALKEKIEQVDHVETALWYDSLADISVPMEILPDEVYNAFNSENSTVIAVFFDSSTSSDVTMDAIREIRSITGEKSFVSGIQPVPGHKAVQGHVLALERSHPVAVLCKNAAQCGAQQAFACTAHGALHHNAGCFVHASTSARVFNSSSFSDPVRTAVRYQLPSSPG